MNKKQKKKLALLAIILAVVIVVLLLVTIVANCTGCVGTAQETASNSVQQRSSVIISEVLASNKQAVRDPMGTYSDYIELYNTSGQPFAQSLAELIHVGLLGDESIAHRRDLA